MITAQFQSQALKISTPNLESRIHNMAKLTKALGADNNLVIVGKNPALIATINNNDEYVIPYYEGNTNSKQLSSTADLNRIFNSVQFLDTNNTGPVIVPITGCGIEYR